MTAWSRRVSAPTRAAMRWPRSRQINMSCERSSRYSRMMSLRCRAEALPGDVAQVVTDHIFAQPVEIASLAQARRRAAAETLEEEPVEPAAQPFHGAQVGQDGDLRLRDRLAVGGAERGRQRALHPAVKRGRSPRRIERGAAARDGPHRNFRSQHLARTAHAAKHARRLRQKPRPDLPDGERDRPAGEVVIRSGRISSSSRARTMAFGRSAVTISRRNASASAIARPATAASARPKPTRAPARTAPAARPGRGRAARGSATFPASLTPFPLSPTLSPVPVEREPARPLSAQV